MDAVTLGKAITLCIENAIRRGRPTGELVVNPDPASPELAGFLGKKDLLIRVKASGKRNNGKTVG